jgi:hypothetical protein
MASFRDALVRGRCVGWGRVAIGLGSVSVGGGVAAAWGAARAEALATTHHPAITEVLFNVPRGEAGDADRDGVRRATDDEFVELFNGGDATIDLAGYRLISRLAWADRDEPGGGSKGVRFTFPEGSALEPGQLVVVFNGGPKARVPGPVGDAEQPPASGNPRFDGAMVFTAGLGGNKAFANAGDFVLLLDPAGRPVDGVVWGEPSVSPPNADAGGPWGGYRLQRVDDDPGGSVQRLGAYGDLEAHRSIDGRRFSPGVMPTAAERAATP